MRWLPFLWLRTLSCQIVPLAALISLQTLQDALRVWGYLAVTLFIMIESSGIPFPGETMLLLASFSAATIVPQLNIVLIIAFAALGAIIGDNIGYSIGHTGGRAVIKRFGRYVFLKPQHLEQAEKFFVQHGNKTVFFGRFISILRAWSAFLAGVHNMNWRVFLFYNAAGGILWAIIFGTFGFVAGRVFHENFSQIEQLSGDSSLVGTVALVVIVVLGFVLFRLLRSRRSHTASTVLSEEDPSSPLEEISSNTALTSTDHDCMSTNVAPIQEDFT